MPRARQSGQASKRRLQAQTPVCSTIDSKFCRHRPYQRYLLVGSKKFCRTLCPPIHAYSLVSSIVKLQLKLCHYFQPGWYSKTTCIMRRLNARGYDYGLITHTSPRLLRWTDGRTQRGRELLIRAQKGADRPNPSLMFFLIVPPGIPPPPPPSPPSDPLPKLNG